MSEYTLLNTLYVQTEGSYLHLDNDTIRIEVERQTRLRVPLHHLSGIVLTGDILVSPALLGRCAESGIGVVFLDRSGRFRARVEGPVSGNVLLRQAQFAAASVPEQRLALARPIVAGKIRNARHVVQRGARDAKSADDAAALTATATHLESALRVAADIVRGRTVSPGVRAMVVPGSGLVKAQAEEEGLDEVFRAAGFDWREPGCSMCLGMNPDRLAPGERCASTSLVVAVVPILGGAVRPRRLRGVNARALLRASKAETWLTAPIPIRTGDRLPPPCSRVDGIGEVRCLRMKPQRVTDILSRRVGC